MEAHGGHSKAKAGALLVERQSLGTLLVGFTQREIVFTKERMNAARIPNSQSEQSMRKLPTCELKFFAHMRHTERRFSQKHESLGTAQPLISINHIVPSPLLLVDSQPTPPWTITKSSKP